MSKSTSDAGIPMLTEVIAAPPPTPSAAQPAIAPPGETAEPPLLTEPYTPEAEAIEGWLEGEWSRMEQKICARTLAQLQARIEPVLARQISDSLAAGIESAVADLQQQLQYTLQQTLEKAVREAVAQEIDSIRFSKN